MEHAVDYPQWGLDASSSDPQLVLVDLVGGKVSVSSHPPLVVGANCPERRLSSTFHQPIKFYMGMYAALGLSQALFTFAL